MFRTLSFRFGIMLFLIFLAFFFDANNGEFVWEMQSGICNEYDFQTRQCLSIEEPKNFPKWWLLLIFQPYFLFGYSLFVVHISKLETWSISWKEPIIFQKMLVNFVLV